MQINEDNKNEINILGKEFLINNYKKLRIISNNKEIKIKNFIIKNESSKKNIKIKIEIINRLIDMSYMFYDCKTLILISNISKLNTNKVNNMKALFSKCGKLKSLPDISKWDITKVRDVSYMFSGCQLLESLPNISKWNTNNVLNISSMFYFCVKLKALPDISEWNTNNIINMIIMPNLFENCFLIVNH